MRILKIILALSIIVLLCIFLLMFRFDVIPELGVKFDRWTGNALPLFTDTSSDIQKQELTWTELNSLKYEAEEIKKRLEFFGAKNLSLASWKILLLGSGSADTLAFLMADSLYYEIVALSHELTQRKALAELQAMKTKLAGSSLLKK